MKRAPLGSLESCPGLALSNLPTATTPPTATASCLRGVGDPSCGARRAAELRPADVGQGHHGRAEGQVAALAAKA